MKKYFAFFTVVAAASLVAAFIPRKSPSPQRHIASGIRWNGGKQQGPFDMRSSIPANQPVVANKEIPVDMVLIFKTDCNRLQTHVRGVDGVQVLSAASFQHGTCEAGREVSNPVRVRIPAGTRGFLAIDVKYETADGRVYEETRAIEISDEKGRKDFISKAQARQGEGPAFQKVHVFAAEESVIPDAKAPRPRR